jgi:GDP-4-dehydro-6-deoxy-D-mannose reductase
MQKKILITGANGMVGKALIRHLLKDTSWDIFAISRTEATFPESKNIHVFSIDLLNEAALNTALQTIQPQYIINLAAQSSVGLSWKDPQATIIDNVKMFVNLLDAIRRFSPNTLMLHVGSAEVYGSHSSENLLSENDELYPDNPYSISRWLQEKIAIFYQQHFQLKIICTRSFNHLSELQKDHFFIPSVIKQIIAAKNKGLKKLSLQVGNIEVVRDFLDVQDVIEAYIGLLNFGHIGETYNICSAQAFPLKDIIYKISKMAGIELEITINPEYLRAKDIAHLVGDNTKIKQALNWQPKIGIDVTLSKIYQHLLHSSD